MNNSDFSDLPEYVRPFAEAVMNGFAKLGPGFEPEPAMVQTLAWRRWAKTRTNDELSAVLLHTRNQLWAADNLVTAQIEEAAMRLKRK